MKIAVTSDTLGNLPQITGEYDLFIHCGNFSPQFPEEIPQIQIENQLLWITHEFDPWLKKIKAKHKVLIAGHTDFGAQFMGRDLQYHVDAMFIQDEVFQIEHKLFYATSWIYPTEHLLAAEPSIDENAVFISKTEEIFAAACNSIPNNVDILITRMPPYGILDEVLGQNIGSKALLEKINSIKGLRLHVFGLAHEQGGCHVSIGRCMFANASVKGYMVMTV